VNTDTAWTVIPSDRALFRRGQDIFRRHQDKHWSMTDCISFAVMKQRHLRDALTADRHFEQAGFRALLL
jgi:predicted nucleic acid-binding protein